MSTGHEHCHCHYRPDLVAFRVRNLNESDRESTIARAEEVTNGTRVESGEACTMLAGLDVVTVDRLLENVGLVRIPPGANPHELAQELDGEMGASPVHGVGFLGHAGYQGAALSLPGDPIEDVETLGEGIIAVVDSGLAPSEDLPGWMKNGDVIVDRPADTEHVPQKHPVSHGTFVSSQLRVLGRRVSLASARPDTGYLTTDESPHSDGAAPRPTDELNVLGAVIRLLDRHSDEDDVKGLTMALGVHECTPSGAMVALRTAVELWNDRFEDRAPIIAAAGNSLCEEPIYPAAWSGDETLHIEAIAAECSGEEGPREVVWDDQFREVPPPPSRYWVTATAAGCDINALTGQSPTHTAKWGGSSFAAATFASGL